MNFPELERLERAIMDSFLFRPRIARHWDPEFEEYTNDPNMERFEVLYDWYEKVMRMGVAATNRIIWARTGIKNGWDILDQYHKANHVAKPFRAASHLPLSESLYSRDSFERNLLPMLEKVRREEEDRQLKNLLVAVFGAESENVVDAKA